MYHQLQLQMQFQVRYAIMIGIARMLDLTALMELVPIQAVDSILNVQVIQIATSDITATKTLVNANL